MEGEGEWEGEVKGEVKGEGEGEGESICRLSIKITLSLVGKSQLFFWSLVGNILLVLSVDSKMFPPLSLVG